MTRSKLTEKALILTLFVFALLPVVKGHCGGIAFAKGQIVKSGEKGLVIEIDLNKSQLNSAILSLLIPKEFEIVKAEPNFSNFLKDNSIAKWLIRPNSSNKIKIFIEFNKEIDDLSKFKATIQYKEPSSGIIKDKELIIKK